MAATVSGARRATSATSSDSKRFFAHHGLELGKARCFEALDLNGLIGFYLNGRNEAEASEPGPTEPPANDET